MLMLRASFRMLIIRGQSSVGFSATDSGLFCLWLHRAEVSLVYFFRDRHSRRPAAAARVSERSEFVETYLL